MKDYKLEIGNSTTSQIGAVFYIQAPNKKIALENLREEYEETIELETGRYYRNVYLNWDKITTKDIEEA